MSGGSHGYIGHRMEDQDVIQQERDLLGLTYALQRYLAMTLGEDDAYDREPPHRRRTPTVAELVSAQRGGTVVLAKLADLARTIETLKAQALELAPVGRALDRADSGDGCAWDVLQAVSRFSP